MTGHFVVIYTYHSAVRLFMRNVMHRNIYRYFSNPKLFKYLICSDRQEHGTQYYTVLLFFFFFFDNIKTYLIWWIITVKIWLYANACTIDTRDGGDDNMWVKCMNDIFVYYYFPYTHRKVNLMYYVINRNPTFIRGN